MDALLCNYRRYQGRAKSLSRSSGSVLQGRREKERPLQDAREIAQGYSLALLRGRPACAPRGGARACVDAGNFTCARVYIRIRARAEKDIIGEGHSVRKRYESAGLRQSNARDAKSILLV